MAISFGGFDSFHLAHLCSEAHGYTNAMLRLILPFLVACSRHSGVSPVGDVPMPRPLCARPMRTADVEEDETDGETTPGTTEKRRTNNRHQRTPMTMTEWMNPPRPLKMNPRTTTMIPWPSGCDHGLPRSNNNLEAAGLTDLNEMEQGLHR